LELLVGRPDDGLLKKRALIQTSQVQFMVQNNNRLANEIWIFLDCSRQPDTFA